jgi:hypothetical protein
MTMVPLLAHQGGWDEVLLVAGPIAIIVIVLAIVKRRVDAQVAEAGETAPGRDDTGPDL